MKNKKVKKTKKNTFLSALLKPCLFLYKLFDQYIITPISKLVVKIMKKLKFNNSYIEKILNKPNTIIVLSLIIAVGCFVLVNSKTLKLVESEAEILSAQELTVIYNEEAYVVDGLPTDVDITLIGRRSDLYLAKQLGDHRITLDLSGYGPGEHKVKLRYNHSVETVKYKLDPSTVTVIIREKKSAVKSLTYDILNRDKLNPKLSIGNVTIANDVIVKGSAETLNQVATVKALIDVGNEELAQAGTFTIDSIPLVAYNESGEVIKNVEIVPEKISAEVIVTSYSIEVPVKVVPSGVPATGYAIDTINTSTSKVTIYGEQSVLDDLKYIEAPIDISKLSSNKSFSVSLTKPSGVKYMSETSTNVEVTLDIETSIEIEVPSLIPEGLGSSLIANAASKDDTSVVVVAKGTKKALESLEIDKVRAIVDLTGYGIGTHNVPVTVVGEDTRITFIPKVKTKDIIISTKK